MGLLNAIVDFLQRIFQWWFTVMPWEQALRIRRGRSVRLLGAGLYLKIPFIDAVYIQTTRMRMVDTPMQTISTKDGNTITIKAAIGYSIGSIELLYSTLYHPEMTLNSIAMGYIGEYARSHDINEISPKQIEDAIGEKINAEAYGLKNFSVRITSFAIVKTFRLIQDSSGMYEGLNMLPEK